MRDGTKSREAHRNDEVRAFQDRAFTYSPRWTQTDSFNWQSQMTQQALFSKASYSSVCYNQIYACTVFEPIMDSGLPEVTWGHSCTSGAQRPELEKPLWLVCIHCVPRAYTAMLEMFLWLFCSISVSSLGLPWGVSGVEFRDQLESFLARPPLLFQA